MSNRIENVNGLKPLLSRDPRPAAKRAGTSLKKEYDERNRVEGHYFAPGQGRLYGSILMAPSPPARSQCRRFRPVRDVTPVGWTSPSPSRFSRMDRKRGNIVVLRVVPSSKKPAPTRRVSSRAWPKFRLPKAWSKNITDYGAFVGPSAVLTVCSMLPISATSGQFTRNEMINHRRHAESSRSSRSTRHAAISLGMKQL